MTFEGQYLTYAEFQELGGSAIGEMPFNILEINARNQIDLRTQNRLVNAETIPFKVKICMFELINKILNYAKSSDEISSNDVASESIDGYSVSYITPTQIKEIIVSKETELEDIMLTGLYGVVVNNVAILYNGDK